MAAITAAEFEAAESRLAVRREGYLSKRVKQPLIRIWDKEMGGKPAHPIARVAIPEKWDDEELAYEDGLAHIEIVGKDNDWLREIVVFKTRPEEDLHITIDPDPDKPHDFKNRWGGKVMTIEDTEEKGKATTTVITAVSNTRHLSKVSLAATPLLPPAFQPIRLFLWGGSMCSAAATATMINLARMYTLNSFSPIPRDIMHPQNWLKGLGPLDWPVQVMPVNSALDQSRWETFAARWQDAKTVLTPALKDAGVVPRAYTWLPGDPAPYTLWGKEMAELLRPRRACTIISFEDMSGATGLTGTAVDGGINLLAATADNLFTELLFPVDGDGDGETDPFIRKMLGAAPKRPPFVYRDVGYGSTNMRKMIIHKCEATDIVVGGKSPAWVNMALTWGIRYGLSQLAQVINYGLGAYQQYGTEGLDNLYQGQADDTVLPFMIITDPVLAGKVGSYAFREHYEQGSGTAFTFSSILTAREGRRKTAPYITFKFEVGDGSPFVWGEDLTLGTRVQVERRGVLYTDQIYGVKKAGSRTQSGRPVIAFGDDSRDLDPTSRGISAIANVGKLVSSLAGSTDIF